MAYTIICPYCFKTFDHREVHFRSEKVNQGECEVLPKEYADESQFENEYKGADKKQLLDLYREWMFFQERKDPLYEEFWCDKESGFGGTTEVNPSDEILNVKSYLRPVINPSLYEHRKYLKAQESGDYLIYDIDGFATSIEVSYHSTTDFDKFKNMKCSRRVCPFCHNPLPLFYGKNQVKFTTVIGVTGAGKTVYLSQLIYGLEEYMNHIGLSAMATTTSPREFVRNNRVSVGQTLPGATPPSQLLQPIFYDLIRYNGDNQKYTETLVLYDVAGENCVNPEYMRRFSPFIQHADGIFLLIDPAQFSVLRELMDQGEEKSTPTEVLQAIYGVVLQGKASQLCDTPIAICISKSDMEELQNVMDESLANRLKDEVVCLKDSRGHGISAFNATNYNPIAQGLRKFMDEYESRLELMMYNNYSRYNYFAFSSLGCEVGENHKPIGPILPKRIEEPLFWLLYQFGYIDTDIPVYLPNPKIEAQEIEVKRSFFGRLFKRKSKMPE